MDYLADVNTIILDTDGKLYFDKFSKKKKGWILYTNSEVYPFETTKVFIESDWVYYSYTTMKGLRIEYIDLYPAKNNIFYSYHIDLRAKVVRLDNFDEVIYDNSKNFDRGFQNFLVTLIGKMKKYKEVEDLYKYDIGLLSQYLNDYGRIKCDIK